MHKKNLFRGLPPLSLTRLDNRHLLSGELNEPEIPEPTTSFTKTDYTLIGGTWGTVIGAWTGGTLSFLFLQITHPTYQERICSIMAVGTFPSAITGAVIGSNLGNLYYEHKEIPA